MEVFAGLAYDVEGFGHGILGTIYVACRSVQLREVAEVGGREGLLAHQPQGRHGLLQEIAMRLPAGRILRDICGSECGPEHIAVLLADADHLRTQLPTRVVIAEEASDPGCIDLDEGATEWAAREADLLRPPESLALPVPGPVELSAERAHRGEGDLGDCDRVVGK